MSRNLPSLNDTMHLTTGRKILSSTITKEEAAALVRRFTGNTSGLSFRKAASLIGVTAPTIQGLREWEEAGADPEQLSASEKTLGGIRAYLAVADEIETRRAALRLAAGRLRELAADLEGEAASPSAGAIADEVEDALRDQEEKRARNGGGGPKTRKRGKQ